MKNRRTFLKIVLAGIVSFFIVIWNKLTMEHLQTKDGKNKILPFNKNKAVIFNNNYIIVTQNNSTKVFSAHCTHLGCKIDKQDGDRFVCPCHGSEYTLDGKVQKGPAYKNLEIVPFEISEDRKNIIIKG